MRTLIVHIELNATLNTKDSFFKCQVKRCFNVATALWSTLLLTSAATKELTKDITEATITKVEVNILTIKTAEALERIT